MDSPNFNISELPHLREIVWRAQEMARIGNWLSTWEREFDVGDFTSGVFGYYVREGMLNPINFQNKDKKKISEKIRKLKVREYFLERWQNKYEEIERLAPKGSDIL